MGKTASFTLVIMCPMFVVDDTVPYQKLFMHICHLLGKTCKELNGISKNFLNSMCRGAEALFEAPEASAEISDARRPSYEIMAPLAAASGDVKELGENVLNFLLNWFQSNCMQKKLVEVTSFFCMQLN